MVVVSGACQTFSGLVSAVFCKEGNGCRKFLPVAIGWGRFCLLHRWSTHHSERVGVAVLCLLGVGTVTRSDSSLAKADKGLNLFHLQLNKD
jgi:hypothetical protein